MLGEVAAQEGEGDASTNNRGGEASINAEATRQNPPHPAPCAPQVRSQSPTSVLERHPVETSSDIADTDSASTAARIQEDPEYEEFQAFKRAKLAADSACGDDRNAITMQDISDMRLRRDDSYSRPVHATMQDRLETPDPPRESSGGNSAADEDLVDLMELDDFHTSYLPFGSNCSHPTINALIPSTASLIDSPMPSVVPLAPPPPPPRSLRPLPSRARQPSGHTPPMQGFNPLISPPGRTPPVRGSNPVTSPPSHTPPTTCPFDTLGNATPATTLVSNTPTPNTCSPPEDMDMEDWNFLHFDPTSNRRTRAVTLASNTPLTNNSAPLPDVEMGDTVSLPTTKLEPQKFYRRYRRLFIYYLLQ